MAIPIEIPPFDPTGTLASNFIPNETHTLQPMDWKEERFIVPRVGPYFASSLVVSTSDSTIPLVEGVDYLLTHHFLDASRATGKPIYGSITFLDVSVGVTVILNYQSLGGEYVINDPALLERILTDTSNPRITTWEYVAEVPAQFPVIDHEFDLVDLVGMSDIKASLSDLSETISNRPNPILTLLTHIENRDNPHGVTKTHVDLGNVQNYPIATELDSEAGLRNDRYMTPLLTKVAITRNNNGFYSKSEVDALLAQLKLDIINGV